MGDYWNDSGWYEQQRDSYFQAQAERAAENARWQEIRQEQRMADEVARSSQQSSSIGGGLSGSDWGSSSVGSGTSTSSTKSGGGSRFLWALALVGAYFLFFSQNIPESGRGVATAVVIILAILLAVGILGRLVKIVVGLIVIGFVLLIAFNIIIALFVH